MVGMITNESTTNFKLVSVKGTLLGTVTIPKHWADALKDRGEVRFATTPSIPSWCEAGRVAPFELYQGALYVDYSSGIYGAVMLLGVSLEEFEKLEGCSFIPGAGYLRSIIE